MKKTVDAVGSVLVIAIALLVGAAVVKSYFFAPDQPIITAEDLPPGTRVPLPGVKWQARSVVLALSTRCHYCSEEAPFYRRLADSAASHGVQLVAVFPEAVEEGRKYLDGLGVAVGRIEQAHAVLRLVKGTPTVLIVDRDGKVEQSWRGQLRSDREAQVLAALARS
jgi:thiol-disulfide isomerase/thioredoxin